MRVATLGFVTKRDEYVDKKTGELVRFVFVAASDQMLRVKLTKDEAFAVMDEVLVSGEVKLFERRFYIDDARIRLASAEDRLFLADGPSATDVTMSFDKGVQDGGADLQLPGKLHK